jgi:uridine phosphorylase
MEQIRRPRFLPDVAALPKTARFGVSMPARLRPTAPIAAGAILVGDPGRALMLAQELLEQPKMSNHARGLWGYFGRTAAGEELTIQSTGMGGPSATVVLADLAELGVHRAVRIGTCASVGDLEPGDLLLVAEGRLPQGDPVRPERELTAALDSALPAARTGAVLSLDDLHRGRDTSQPVDGVDMQTAALFTAARDHGVAVAALLVVSEKGHGEHLDDERLTERAQEAGRAAAGVLSG